MLLTSTLSIKPITALAEVKMPNPNREPLYSGGANGICKEKCRYECDRSKVYHPSACGEEGV